MAVLEIVPWLIKPLLISATTILVLSWCFIQQRRNLPPGPWGIPGLGCLPMLAFRLCRSGDEPEHLLAKMATTYGDVFSMYVGTKLVVVVNSYKSISEAFQNPNLNDRPMSRIFQETSLDSGVLMASGDSWKHQRKFTVSTLRSFGVGKSSFEGQISLEADSLVHHMCKNSGIQFDPSVLIGNCVSNVVCSVVFGKRYEHSDPDFKRLLEILWESAEKSGSGGAELFLPFLRYISQEKHKTLTSLLLELRFFVEDIVKEHSLQQHENENPNDLIDVFLSEIDLNKSENDDHGQDINHKSLVATCIFLFLAGSETTATTLNWAMLYMMNYPEIQSKIQEEIDTVVGRQRMPALADKPDLPYTDAVLLEIQRVRTVLPLGFPHVAAENTTLSGFDIPKDTVIASNIWAVHNDPSMWKEPDKFKPARFLDDNGSVCVRDDLIPFSAGRRKCLGETLAKMELFIFFTHILHQFTITRPLSVQPHSLKGVNGVTYRPMNYDIIVDKRL